MPQAEPPETRRRIPKKQKQVACVIHGRGLGCDECEKQQACEACLKVALEPPLLWPHGTVRGARDGGGRGVPAPTAQAAAERGGKRRRGGEHTTELVARRRMDHRRRRAEGDDALGGIREGSPHRNIAALLLEQGPPAHLDPEVLEPPMRALPQLGGEEEG